MLRAAFLYCIQPRRFGTMVYKPHAKARREDKARPKAVTYQAISTTLFEENSRHSITLCDHESPNCHQLSRTCTARCRLQTTVCSPPSPCSTASRRPAMRPQPCQRPRRRHHRGPASRSTRTSPSRPSPEPQKTSTTPGSTPAIITPKVPPNDPLSSPTRPHLPPRRQAHRQPPVLTSPLTPGTHPTSPTRTRFRQVRSATRPASTNAAVPRRCARLWPRPSSGPPAQPAPCLA